MSIHKILKWIIQGVIITIKLKVVIFNREISRQGPSLAWISRLKWSLSIIRQQSSQQQLKVEALCHRKKHYPFY